MPDCTTMKYTGQEWIEVIPASWKVAKLSTSFSFYKGLSITKADLVERGTPVISYGQIHSKSNTGTHISDELIRYIPEKYLTKSPEFLLEYGDIVLADTSEDLEGLGNAILMDRREPIFAGYHTIIMRPQYAENSKYISYLLKTDCWRSQLRANATGIKVYSVTQRMLRNCFIILPPLKEQSSITSYLDTQCAKIDAIIAEIKINIDEYKKWKKSIIFETVTKGIHHSVRMKNSGIEYIGEIPSNWSILPIKYCFRTGSGSTPDSKNHDFWDGDIPWITPADFKTEDIYVSKGHAYITQKGLDSCSTKIIPQGSIIFSKRAPIGSIVSGL